MNKKANVGGMALLEGIMMIGPDKKAVAVRKPDGEIALKQEKLKYSKAIKKIPFLRGVNGLFNQMVHGMKAMMYAADFYDIEEDEEKISKFEKWLEKILGDKLKTVIIYFSVIIALLFSVGIFILLPNVVVGFFNIDGSIVNNLIEGMIRMSLFVVYVGLISRMNDIKRVWQYHGAEHKTIHCYEGGQELTVENVKSYSTKHKRCGTSFMFVVIVISIFVFALSGWHSAWMNLLLRIILIPFVAGISYEIIRLAGKKENWFSKALSAPGILFQKFTTQEPEDDMLEIAIVALNAVVEEVEESCEECTQPDSASI